MKWIPVVIDPTSLDDHRWTNIWLTTPLLEFGIHKNLLMGPARPSMELDRFVVVSMGRIRLWCTHRCGIHAWFPMNSSPRDIWLDLDHSRIRVVEDNSDRLGFPRF